jgi:hypothetical protein
VSDPEVLAELPDDDKDETKVGLELAGSAVVDVLASGAGGEL